MENEMISVLSSKGFESSNGFWYSELSVKQFELQNPITGITYSLMNSVLEIPFFSKESLNKVAYHIFTSEKYHTVNSKGEVISRIYIPDGVIIVQKYTRIDSDLAEEFMCAALEKASKDFGVYAKDVCLRLRRLEASRL